MKDGKVILELSSGSYSFEIGKQDKLLFTPDADELWNGDIAEQVVGQELLGATVTFGEKRMFWVRDARNS